MAGTLRKAGWSCFVIALIVILSTVESGLPVSKACGDRFLTAVQSFADCVLQHGRDTYGEYATPLFADGLHAGTLEPPEWWSWGKSRIVSNFASQQTLLRTLDGLSTLTGDRRYRAAAEDVTKYVLTQTRHRCGLLYWGGHAAWDLRGDEMCSENIIPLHELKGNQPYFELMWRVDNVAATDLVEAIWAAHIVDWPSLDYDRHGTYELSAPNWDSSFAEDLEVPFPSSHSGYSFCNTMPALLRSGVLLATLAGNDKALAWVVRLVERWEQARHPLTGLAGSLLSLPREDRAKEALGDAYPGITEAEILTGLKASDRYHKLPIALMQAGLVLIGGQHSGVSVDAGWKLIVSASQDLKNYARSCYDWDMGAFRPMMTDGTILDGSRSKEGYFSPASFALWEPDSWLLWATAMAFRLTEDTAHWRMLQEWFQVLGLGSLGDRDGAGRNMRLDSRCTDWRMIYALLELYAATKSGDFLQVAVSVGDNLLALQATSGLFPRCGYVYARTGDEIPLALLHLAGAIDGKDALLPMPVLDAQYFHAVFDMSPPDSKRDEPLRSRTYDYLVFYGAQ
jgi:pectate lyase